MNDVIKKRIKDNNREIANARLVYETIKSPGFKIINEWLIEQQKRYENVPVQAIKDEAHLQFLKGGAEYGRELNAQLVYWEKKAHEEEKEVPKS